MSATLLDLYGLHINFSFVDLSDRPTTCNVSGSGSWSHTAGKWHGEVCLPPGLELLPPGYTGVGAPAQGLLRLRSVGRALLSPPSQAQAAHLTDQAVVGVEVPVDDVHGVEVGLGEGHRGQEEAALKDPSPGPGGSHLPSRPIRLLGCPPHSPFGPLFTLKASLWNFRSAERMLL